MERIETIENTRHLDAAQLPGSRDYVLRLIDTVYRSFPQEMRRQPLPPKRVEPLVFELISLFPTAMGTWGIGVSAVRSLATRVPMHVVASEVSQVERTTGLQQDVDTLAKTIQRVTQQRHRNMPTTRFPTIGESYQALLFKLEDFAVTFTEKGEDDRAKKILEKLVELVEEKIHEKPAKRAKGAPVKAIGATKTPRRRTAKQA